MPATNMEAPQSNTPSQRNYFGINLTVPVQASHAESYLALIQEVQDRNKWKRYTTFVIWKTRHRHDVNSPQTDRVNAVPIKVLSALFVFVEIDKNIPKCMWKDKGSRVVSKTILKIILMGEHSLQSFRT